MLRFGSQRSSYSRPLRPQAQVQAYLGCGDGEKGGERPCNALAKRLNSSHAVTEARLYSHRH